jgi:hypothetical protein
VRQKPDSSRNWGGSVQHGSCSGRKIRKFRAAKRHGRNDGIFYSSPIYARNQIGKVATPGAVAPKHECEDEGLGQHEQPAIKPLGTEAWVVSRGAGRSPPPRAISRRSVAAFRACRRQVFRKQSFERNHVNHKEPL